MLQIYLYKIQGGQNIFFKNHFFGHLELEDFETK